MKLVIIRHPETNKIAGLPGDSESPSPEGQKQLARVIDTCRQEHVQAVVHSILPRTTIAAKALADSLDVPCLAQDGLQERDFGDWDGWEWPQIAARLDKLNLEDRYTFVPPNGESWEQMDVRLQGALQTISALGYDSVAVMTHYGAIRALLPILRKEPKESTLQLVVANGEVFTEEYPS